MRIAVVHDYLCGMGGSERVFQYICEEFPEADAFALAYNPDATLPYFRHRRIRTTWLNSIVQSMRAFRWAFPIATYAMELLDLRNYDVVLSSSATVAKYVRVPNGKHICYCYIPTRALWQTREYFQGGLASQLIKPLLPSLRRRDYAAAQRVDQFIAISETTRSHIARTYHRESRVIFSPISLDCFSPRAERGDHYLLVSRLEQWKRVDYAIEGFNELGLPLRVIGTGSEETRLRAMARRNIAFLGAVDDAALAREYAQAKAVVFTPFLEYGLIPLEANASGTPVICYGKGGVTETMIPYNARSGTSEAPTAVFFPEQTAAALIDAIHQFEHVTFHPDSLLKHASRWGIAAFKRQLRDAVNEVVTSG